MRVRANVADLPAIAIADVLRIEIAVCLNKRPNMSGRVVTYDRRVRRQAIPQQVSRLGTARLIKCSTHNEIAIVFEETKLFLG